MITFLDAWLLILFHPLLGLPQFIEGSLQFGEGGLQVFSGLLHLLMAFFELGLVGFFGLELRFRLLELLAGSLELLLQIVKLINGLSGDGRLQRLLWLDDLGDVIGGVVSGGPWL